MFGGKSNARDHAYICLKNTAYLIKESYCSRYNKLIENLKQLIFDLEHKIGSINSRQGIYDGNKTVEYQDLNKFIVTI
jgi:hypothetical protein